MKKLKSIALIVLGIVAVVFEAESQGFNSKNRYISIGGCLNAMNYVGELDPGPSFLSPGIKFTRYNFGITGLYRLQPRVSVRGTFSYGRIKGSDAENANFSEKNLGRKLRNLNFRNQIYEFKVDAVIDLFENRGNYRKRPDYTPYMFVGVAYFHHNPEGLYKGSWVNLRNYSTEGQGLPDGPKQYSLHQIALPIGLGFRYKLSKQLDLAFEMGWRFTTTDYLDDVGGKYYDKETLRAAKGDDAVALSDRTPELIGTDMDPYIFVPGRGLYSDGGGNVSVIGYGNSGDQRGDLKGKRDVYIISGFHLTYIIPGRVICPKFR